MPESSPGVDVGDTVEVFWEADASYYTAEICGYNKATQQHKMEYEDGSSEWLVVRAH